MDDCIFCRIARGEVAADLVLEDADFVAFRDLSPQAPEHVLVIPRTHVGSLNDLGSSDDLEARALLHFLVATAERVGIKDTGYRVITNVGKDGGQEVQHLHFHILGGEELGNLR